MCSPQGQALEPGPSNPPTLNEKELLAYKSKGRGTLTGQVFLGSPSGKAITQAGVPVHLIPVTHYTRYWFDRNVRTTSCFSKGEAASTENSATSRPSADCLHDALAQLLAEKRLLPYLRTTRANPTGHFWFTKIPAGRYYVVSVIEGGVGSHQDERAAGLAWSTIDLEAGEKATNLVVTDCRSRLC
ncbi:MAG: hypothetical protein HY038_05595 [Nitrospirae bacterium]|nr:hypothetical protein [Nitrospirota bacterium]